MALDWIPIVPDQVPRRRRRQPGGTVAPFAAVTIPVPVIPGLLAFAPTYPGQVPHRHSHAARTELVEPPIFPAAIAPTGWLPIYPSAAPRHPRPVQRPAVFEPPPGVQVVIAQQGAWRPTYPGIVHRTPPPPPDSLTYVPPPAVVSSGIHCLFFVDDRLTAPALIEETGTSPAFVAEALGSPAFINEELCAPPSTGGRPEEPSTAVGLDAFQDDAFQEDSFQ